jgi:CheY-like chemotaxis protein
VVDAVAARSAAVDEAMAGAHIQSAAGPEAVRAALQETAFDLIVLDMTASPAEGLAMLREWRDEPATAQTPIIVFHDPQATQEQIDQATLLANALIADDDAAHTRLLDETARFLRRIGGGESPEQADALDSLYRSDAALAGRVILIVDDDPRNVFSLATILEQHEVTILDAEDGMAALEVLDQRPDIDLVLMDVMMPRMDGLEATARIRANPATGDLPVIAVTALAMPEDRQRCLAAGASDYISKPVDAAQLVSLIRVWLRARP